MLLTIPRNYSGLLPRRNIGCDQRLAVWPDMVGDLGGHSEPALGTASAYGLDA
jgi:hypothetical protein